MALVGDGVLAVTEGVPQLDGAVTRSGDDLTVVGGERDGEDVAVVADETAGGGAGSELPQAEGLVPRGRQSVSTIGGDNLYDTNVSHVVPLSGSVSLILNLNSRSTSPGFFRVYVRSRRRCESGRGASAWGSRTGTHRG